MYAHKIIKNDKMITIMNDIELPADRLIEVYNTQ